MSTAHAPQQALIIGADRSFRLPIDLIGQRCAILGISGAGKTTLAHVLAEELARASQPFIVFDPVGVWWGLRATASGEPSSLPIVVMGGQHGDLPLDRSSGAKMAEAIVREGVSTVIDLSEESKRFWHTFVTDFTGQMMAMNPTHPIHLFIEEAPEFVPQRTRQDLTARCKEAVERLVRLGRNRGYGCTLITQRPATVDKDVLSQCENLFVLRTVGKHDRKALEDWIDVNRAEQVAKVVKSLASLPNGEGWFWSPNWLRCFDRVRIRQKTTFHPGATRQVGQAVRKVAMSDVSGFVEQLKRQLTKPVIPGGSPASTGATQVGVKHNERFEHDPARRPTADVGATLTEDLHRQISEWKVRAQQAERRLERVRTLLRSDYEALRHLFEQLGNGAGSGPANRQAYEPWLQKAGRRGCRRMLETLLERPSLSKSQLGTLAGVSFKSSTFRAYMAWLKRNGLIEVNGDAVTLITL